LSPHCMAIASDRSQVEVLARDTTAPTADARHVDTFLAPLDAAAAGSETLFRKPIGVPGPAGLTLPRYFYLGRRSGGDYLRLGIFAAIHGDEPESALGLIQFVERLERNPELGAGYALYLYPVCNPTGLADGTRHSRSGKDLNREFWKRSPEPEVRCLESEIGDDTSDGLYGYVNGQVLSENLLEPALRAGERFLPRDRRARIDGFPARNGIIYEGYDGVLRSAPGLSAPPFEIVFETPQLAPRPLQVEAFAAALESILREFRTLTSVGQGI
jgi:protein MpaA